MLIWAVIKSECEKIAGRKDAKNPLRTANWWGSQLSPVYKKKSSISRHFVKATADENATVCNNLLDDIERRGLDMNRDYLFC